MGLAADAWQGARVEVHRVLCVFVCLAAGMARAHDVVQVAELEKALGEVARLRDSARTGRDAETLYALGERVERIVEILNVDVAAHGESDPLSRLVVERLRSWGIGVALSAEEHRYAYDLKAFRDYLVRAPQGEKAPRARFRLLARDFRGRMGLDPLAPLPIDVAATTRGAEEEESFLRSHPMDEHEREVRLFLAVDLCRLAGADRPAQRGPERRCLDALEVVRTRYPGSMEARAAEVLLEERTARERHPFAGRASVSR